MLMVESAILPAAAAVQQSHWWETLGAWGNIGSFIGGFSAFILATAAIIGGSAGLQDWRARQREQKALAQEQVDSIRLDRYCFLYGWTRGTVSVFGIRLVTEPAEMGVAQDELAGEGLPITSFSVSPRARIVTLIGLVT